MAVPVEFLRAKAALHYQPLNLQETQCKEEESIETKHLGQVTIIEEILLAQDQLNNLKTRCEQLKLLDESVNHLGPDFVNSLNRLSLRINDILKNRDPILQRLRHPIAENSFPLRFDSHKSLIQGLKHLDSLAKDSESNRSNSEWLSNQDWQHFGEELDTMETRLLRLEASIASQLQDVKK